MSELEISNVKYEALKKWQTLGNKADGVEPLLKTLPTYQNMTKSQNNAKKNYTNVDDANRPFFTDETGRAMQAVKNQMSNGFER